MYADGAWGCESPNSSDGAQQHDERSNDSSVPAGIETRTGLSDFSTVEDGSDVVVSQEPKDISISKYDPIDTEEAIQEASSDESWQEASSKVRTGHAASRKFGRRCPDLAKLKISKNEYNNPRETNHRREAMFIRQKATPRTISTKPSKKRHTKVLCSSAGDDTPILQAKTLVSKFSTMQIPKVSPTSSSLTAMASKSLSYKEVVVSPPGTVRKPLLEKGDKSNEVKTDTQICHSSSEKSKENGSMRVTLEEVVPDNEAAKDHISEAPEAETESEEYGEQVLKLGCSGNQDNSVKTTRSKLSAEAEPRNYIHTFLFFKFSFYTSAKTNGR
ncbi:hypothetical protein POM88_001140 [Heracleum sosnowskyi]|uniref:Uncharacterized protein n=1 Tax=Heracleum sosnowskyi TaxID=360622 RepID=A0AAD8N4Q4_9APIA|nr:hypothetical protein POM88_001140 [Heracleum sosnowskyi]